MLFHKTHHRNESLHTRTFADGHGITWSQEPPIQYLNRQLYRFRADVGDGGITFWHPLWISIDLDAGLLTLRVHGQNAHLLEVGLQLDTHTDERKNI